MRSFTLAALVMFIALISSTAIARPPESRQVNPPQAAVVDASAWVDANQLLMFVSNNGSLASDFGRFFGRYQGLYYPYQGIDAIINGTAVKTLFYSAGFWVGGVDSASGDTLVSVFDYDGDYFPGPMQNHTYIPGADSDPAYRVYRLYSDSLAGNPSSDYTNWPVAQGAPLDNLGEPEIIGDQLRWTLFNDANPNVRYNPAGSATPLGLEFHQSAIAFDDIGALGKTVFVRMRIFNKGTKTLHGLRVALWSDPDLGGPADDLVGCDTLLSAGFCYNATNTDAVYTPAPAVGVVLLQGPMVATGNPNDTGLSYGHVWSGYKNLPMSAFSRYINGTDPTSPNQSYHCLMGLNRDGSPLANGSTFMVSGDPVSNSGELDSSPSDRRMLVSTGPISFRPGDSTELVWAIVVGHGSDRLTSVSELKYYTHEVRDSYRNWSSSGGGTSCCKGVTGNVDGDPDEIVDIADLMAMVDYLFFEYQLPGCPEENNVDRDPDQVVDIADLAALVDFLFFDYPLPACP